MGGKVEVEGCGREVSQQNEEDENDKQMQYKNELERSWVRQRETRKAG